MDEQGANLKTPACANVATQLKTGGRAEMPKVINIAQSELAP
jgi:hypothetical protein